MKKICSFLILNLTFISSSQPNRVQAHEQDQKHQEGYQDQGRNWDLWAGIRGLARRSDWATRPQGGVIYSKSPDSDAQIKLNCLGAPLHQPGRDREEIYQEYLGELHKKADSKCPDLEALEPEMQVEIEGEEQEHEKDDEWTLFILS